jgi:uridine phosphorylase
MAYPILEFDPARQAFIEPAKIYKPRDMPEHCVLSFFKEVIDKVVVEHNARIIVNNRWEDGPHPVYEIKHKGKRLAFYHSPVGAALSASLLEEAIAFGSRKFIACGGCGVLEKEIAAGHLIVVSSAVRDEGTSYHYLPPAREVTASPFGLTALQKTMDDQAIPYRVGKTWTTDAPYRETPHKIRQRKEEGCIVVEMEAASMMAVAQFREVTFGQVLYGGDDLSGVEWDRRDWQSRADIRENLFWLCADACLAL